MVELGVRLRFGTGLKVWVRGETQGKQAGGLLVCVMCRGLAMVCRGLSVLLGEVLPLSEGEPRHGYGEPRPIRADLARNRFLTWGC